MSKEYVDQAVQTEPPRHLSRADDPKAPNVHHVQDAYSHSHSKKPSQLGQFSKPSDVLLPAKRIVSLPESSPPHRLKPIVNGERLRASMSEATAIKISTSAESSLSSDCFESSLSMESPRSVSDTYSNHPQRRSSLASLAFPRTPSPPSSPESSIMIIGNHVQVSSSFLRPKPNTKCEDEDDWAVWAGSPPRPIPALHGPLSLPYARCPSGAEGTLVEGEDVSRMIWGLREGEPLPVPPRPEPAEAKAYTVKEFSDGLPLQRTGQYLETPSIASSSPAIPLLREREGNQPSNGLITPRDIDLRWYESDNYDDSPIIIPPTPQQLQNFLELQGIFGSSGIEGVGPEPGLGLFWKGSKPGNRLFDSEIPARLQASAPVFVPNSQINRQKPDAPHVDESVHADFPRRRSVSTIDLAAAACLLQQAKHSLLTPPNSTGAKWTPRFPDQSSLISDAGVYQASLGDEYEVENSPLQSLIVEGSRQSIPHDDSPYMHLNSNSSAPLSSSRSSSDLRPSTTTMTVPPSPQSPEFKLNATHLSGSQPRSVPFARLLQRRLAAVPEETSVRSENSPPTPGLRPPTSKRPGFQNGAQAPNKPYFAQATHNLPDISNKVRSASPDSLPRKDDRPPRSRVATASSVVSRAPAKAAIPEAGPGSPPVKQKPELNTPVLRLSKENGSVKSIDTGSKGNLKRRSRNRAKRSESAGFNKASK
ncbi:hypothetical protein V5O48_005694 [Marasmius crinis-equi]|uniref:Uncharacterized protein n=1 Tax=Marasmius crinis-equi TaxID=585013 RepID=A0ABR3FLL3_9AGAR